MSRRSRCCSRRSPRAAWTSGAIEFIHAELRKARDAGKAVLLVSAELKEVLTLSDRIAVMYGGRLVAMFSRREASEEVIGPFMTGATPRARRVRMP